MTDPKQTDAIEAWQPIEAAPKDGTRVRLLCPDGEDVGFYDDYLANRGAPGIGPHGELLNGEWSTDLGNGEPTHFQPLPEPPKEA